MLFFAVKIVKDRYFLPVWDALYAWHCVQNPFNQRCHSSFQPAVILSMKLGLNFPVFLFGIGFSTIKHYSVSSRKSRAVSSWDEFPLASSGLASRLHYGKLLKWWPVFNVTSKDRYTTGITQELLGCKVPKFCTEVHMHIPPLMQKYITDAQRLPQLQFLNLHMDLLSVKKPLFNHWLRLCTVNHWSIKTFQDIVRVILGFCWDKCIGCFIAVPFVMIVYGEKSHIMEFRSENGHWCNIDEVKDKPTECGPFSLFVQFHSISNISHQVNSRVHGEVLTHCLAMCANIRWEQMC